MSIVSRPGKSTRDRFCSQGGFLAKHKKSWPLSLAWPLSPAWVILVLSLIVLPAAAHASDGEDLLKAAYMETLRKFAPCWRKVPISTIKMDAE